MQSISEVYAEDHDRLDALFQDYLNSKEEAPENALKVFREFKAGLERHIVWEEEILFPRFETVTGMRSSGPTAVMRLEHLSIKNQLREIESKWALGLETGENEAALIEVLCPHNHKEEAILYPAIDQTLSSEEVEKVYGEMKQGVEGAPDGKCCCDNE